MDDCANVVVRNTFLHLSCEDAHDDSEPNARSSSAPPTCRHKEVCEDQFETASVSTRCKTLMTKPSSGNITPSSEAEEDDYETNGLFQGPESDDGGKQDSGQVEQICPEQVQQQLEEMSQKVMSLWSKLRSAEEPLASASSNPTANPQQSWGVAVAVPVVWMPTKQMSPAQWNPYMMPRAMQVPAAPSPPQSIAGSSRSSMSRTHLGAQQLDGRAHRFTPNSKSADVFHTLLASVKECLLLAQGVVGVEVHSGAVGTLTTVSILIDPNGATIASVVDAAKTLFLEAAANSDTVYVMGYEAEPFTSLSDAMFATMLACCPIPWHHSACWDTYQYGACPRGKSCKWQHPGKRELQPVRVTVA